MENIHLSVTENIFEKIKYDIVLGVLKPNQKLKLNLLQKEYNVSISILREVLNRLCGDGFIIYKVQRVRSTCALCVLKLFHLAMHILLTKN